MFDSSGQFEMQVCPNGRAAADEYLHQNTMWIEGREGSRYILRFINRSPGRVCVIFSVDGLDTIKGQPAGPNSEGYIVDANSSLEIPGWKLDDSSAAEFYFNKIGKSYAATSGASTSNVGVIGAMVFREAAVYAQAFQPYTWSGLSLNSVALGGGMSSSASLAGPQGITGAFGSAGPVGAAGGAGMSYGCTTASAAAPMLLSANMMTSNAMGSRAVTASAAMPQNLVSQDVGTGFGDATTFHTSQARFTRWSPGQPDAVLVLYYNTAKNLQKMGIQLRSKNLKYNNSTAKAFPAYNNGCTPPIGWKP